MNLITWNGGYLGFRPENFLPEQMIEGSDASEFSFRVNRAEYLGSERIVYGKVDGCDSEQEVTAKLPLAHVPPQSIRPGEWHTFAVRSHALCHFDSDGKRVYRR
jgi:multiple sugar transport system ATP-binding protein